MQEIIMACTKVIGKTGTCGFCERVVEPEYAYPEEGISGDEFIEWFHDNGDVICDKCTTPNSRYRNSVKWVDTTHISVTCTGCGNEWIVEIPLD